MSYQRRRSIAVNGLVELQIPLFKFDFDGKKVKTANFNIQTGTTRQIVATPVAKATNIADDSFLGSVMFRYLDAEESYDA